MSRRTAAWLAWSLCALSLALTALSLVLLALNLAHLDAHLYDYWLEDTVLAVSLSIIGAIIASRQPLRLALLCSSLLYCNCAP
jgi:hypothetical protein